MQKSFEEVAVVLFGSRWKSAAARFLGVSRSSINRWWIKDRAPSWALKKMTDEAKKRLVGVL